jgi:hypothetical protein
LWTALDEIKASQITAQRTFADFEDYWTTSTLAATVSQTIAAMDPTDVKRPKARMHERRMRIELGSSSAAPVQMQ